ncbi:MAG: (2Fe-2S)-binding protein [Verrucomicrobiales bacterium]|nr:(2Fe-2S)-binding protein [Verrucomicrobiales bacterium]MCP5526766.1 (2Fe-2S)-binding protein [Verrucomicrobiales bacterium]
MITVTIDARSVQVEPGQTLLTAARQLGLEIPTLCHHEKCTPSTSCQVCLVKLTGNGTSRLVPSCATIAEDGMVVESQTAEVFDARRTALELLFSDHVGDCLSPCHRICPLQLNIPRMLREVEAGRIEEATKTVREAIPLAGITGWLCSAPCEQGCRRGTHDQPAAIREVERFLAEREAADEKAVPSRRHPASGRAVAVIGTGPAGLATAHALLHAGHRVTLVDRHPEAGGSLRGEVGEGRLPSRVLRAELDRLERLGARFKLAVELGQDLTIDGLLRGFAAVVLALGEGGKAQASALGLLLQPTGVKTNAETGLTNLARVFATGSIVKPLRQVVRALADGKNVGHAVNRFLAGQVIQRIPKPFSSLMGKLAPDEVRQFMIGPNPAPRVTPGTGPQPGFSRDEARTESSRCLHCDCRSAGDCDLQRYAEIYGVDPGRFRGERRPFEQYLEHGEIIFEPGKCILCGICVQLAEQAREPLGLSFVGRGFDVRIGVPFSREIDEGLQRVGRECVEACPTGALVFKDEFERQMLGFSATGRCGRP